MASFYHYEKATPYRFDRGIVPQTGDLVIVKTTMMSSIYLDDLPMFVVGYVVEAPDNCRDNDVVILLDGETRDIHYSWLRKLS
jgi:hypothetical protein